MNAREIAIVVRNVVLGTNLESLKTLNNPRMAVHFASECRFLYRSLVPVDGLPQKPVWEVFGADELSVKLYGHAAKEWFRPVSSLATDLVSMCMLCRLLNAKVIFEIGTYHGAGALHWAGNAPEANVYTLDLPQSIVPSLPVTTMDIGHIEEHARATQMEFSGTPEALRIHCLYGDTATFDFSPFRGKVDLFFIDGAHSYEYVRNDTLSAFSCCKTGSVIAWHDYGRAGFNGVSRWLHELVREGREIYRVPGGSLAYMRV